MKKLLLMLFVLAFSGPLWAAVDINTASKEELQSVKGIGSSKAEAIIRHRKQHGPFKNVDALNDVKGFGEKSIERLRNELTVSQPSSK